MLTFLTILSLLGAAAYADIIKNLPGYNGDATMYSGYVTVDASHGRNLFYWHVEAAQNKDTAPLVLWLNGGPGCSSVGGGLFSELGPFFPQENSSGDIELVDNKFGWHQVANMIFLESPAGVGFSYSDDPSDYVVGDNRTAEDTWRFLQGFLEDFPNLKGRDFWITGESYGGHYVPTATKAVVDHNEAGDGTHIPIRGFAVGNAWTDAAEDNKGCLEWWWGHTLISNESYSGAMTPGLCNFSNVGPLMEDSSLMVAPITDLNGEPVRDEAGKSCNDYLNQAQEEMGPAFNIYEYDSLVCMSEDGTVRHRPMIERTLEAFGRSSLLKHSKRQLMSIDAVAAATDDDQPAAVGAGCWPGYEPCIDDYTTKYLNDPKVKSIIHANMSITWAECSNIVDYSRFDLLTSMIPVYEYLFTKNLSLNVYSGLHDAIVPTRGTLNWLRLLDLNTEGAYHAWLMNSGQQGGWVQNYDKLSLITVRNAGHMVPGIQPARALHMIRNILNGKKL